MKWRNIYTLLISLALWYGIILLCSNIAHCQEYEGLVDMDIIAKIESNNNPMANSYRGAKYGRGLCQVSEVVLKEWNNTFAIKYTAKDLYTPMINKQVANWYMNTKIKQYLIYYGKKQKRELDTIDNRLIAYNAGISYVVNNKPLPKETRQYLLKYRKLKGIK